LVLEKINATEYIEIGNPVINDFDFMTDVTLEKRDTIDAISGIYFIYTSIELIEMILIGEIAKNSSRINGYTSWNFPPSEENPLFFMGKAVLMFNTSKTPSISDGSSILIPMYDGNKWGIRSINGETQIGTFDANGNIVDSVYSNNQWTNDGICVLDSDAFFAPLSPKPITECEITGNPTISGFDFAIDVAIPQSDIVDIYLKILKGETGNGGISEVEMKTYVDDAINNAINGAIGGSY
jgi:hypothetical protein